MLLKDKNQSKRTIKMDLNNFDKTLLRDVIGKKENNEKSYLFYQELLGHLGYHLGIDMERLSLTSRPSTFQLLRNHLF